MSEESESWLEKGLALLFTIVLLTALTQAFDWHWFDEPEKARSMGVSDSTIRRDWRTGMPYRWIDELENDDVYLIVETFAEPIEVYVQGKGNREVSRRVYMCMSLPEANAVPRVAPMHHRIEIFKVAVNHGGKSGDASTIRRDLRPLLLWSGMASEYRPDGVWAAEAHAEHIRGQKPKDER